jgi:hypothetical protein
MRFQYGKAIGYAVLIWIVGFVWGSIVFMNPSMHGAAIPYISRNPTISFPILIIWFVLTYLLARSFLKNSTTPEADGRKLGLLFAEVNFILDVIVLVILLKAGIGYFAALSIWFAYTMLFMMPWLLGRSLAKARPD